VKVAVALLLIGLALQVRDAHASSSLTTETTREASATFETQLGAVRNSVEVTVAEVEVTSADGTQRSLHANIEILQADARGGDTRIVDVAGGVDTQPGGFDLNEDLSAASLHLTIPVCGAKLLPNGRLKARPLECFDVQVVLEWTGTGEIVSNSGTADYPAGDCTVHVLSSYDRRASSSIGEITSGKTNFTPDQSIASSIGTSSRNVGVTCPD